MARQIAVIDEEWGYAAEQPSVFGDDREHINERLGIAAGNRSCLSCAPDHPMPVDQKDQRHRHKRDRAPAGLPERKVVEAQKDHESNEDKRDCRFLGINCEQEIKYRPATLLVSSIPIEQRSSGGQREHGSHDIVKRFGPADHFRNDRVQGKSKRDQECDQFRPRRFDS